MRASWPWVFVSSGSVTALGVTESRVAADPALPHSRTFGTEVATRSRRRDFCLSSAGSEAAVLGRAPQAATMRKRRRSALSRRAVPRCLRMDWSAVDPRPLLRFVIWASAARCAAGSPVGNRRLCEAQFDRHRRSRPHGRRGSRSREKAGTWPRRLTANDGRAERREFGESEDRAPARRETQSPRPGFIKPLVCGWLHGSYR